MKEKQLYQVLHNNVLLPRRWEMDTEEEREAFATEPLVKLYRENQIMYEEFIKLPDVEIQRIIDKSMALHIDKERFFQIVDLYKS